MALFNLSEGYPMSEQERKMKRLYTSIQPHGETGEDILDLVRQNEISSSMHGKLKEWFKKPGKGLSALIHAKEQGDIQVGYDVKIQYHGRYFPVLFHQHDYYEAVCIVDGICQHFIGSDSGLMHRGDIAIIPPGTKHTIAVYNDYSILYNLAIRRSTLPEVLGGVLSAQHMLATFFKSTMRGDSTSSYIVFHTGDYLLGDNHLASIENEATAQQAYDAEMMNVLTNALFVELMRNYAADAVMSLDEKNTSIDSMILGYIRNHYRTITLAELNRRFHYSERQLSRIVKNKTGKSFTEYLSHLRIASAASLLLNSKLTILQIAEQTGSSNPTHFYRAFRQEYGMTPAEYRDQARQ